MAAFVDPAELAARIRRDAERSVLRARNGLRHLAGVKRPQLATTPKDTVWSSEKVQLWRYRSDRVTLRPPVLLVHSLVSRSYVFDLHPGNSFVQHLLDRGFDLYLIDWGIPDELEAGNTLETYVDGYLPEVVEVVRRMSGGADVNLFGYCFGGLLSLLYLAGHPDDPVRSLAVMATPADFGKLGPLGTMMHQGRIDPRDLVDSTGNVPPDVLLNSFRLLAPTGDVTGYVNLWQNLWNDDYVAAHEVMTQWSRDHIPFPGECFVQVSELFGEGNRLASGRVPLQGGTVDLNDITVPFLSIVGDKDHIVPPASSAPLPGLVGSAESDELLLPAGHVGLIVGKAAHRRNIPAMADWMERHSEPA